MAELTVYKRESLKKSETKRLRRQGDILGIIYGPKQGIETIFIKGDEWETLMKKYPKGRLSTIRFALTFNKKKYNAIVKDIQYNAISYQIEHVDFQVVEENIPVSVNVPIECKSVVDCVGVKLGGFVRQVIWKLKVRCLPKDIPQVFDLDVKAMAIGDARRLSDLTIPENVRPLANMDEVAVAIAKR